MNLDPISPPRPGLRPPEIDPLGPPAGCPPGSADGDDSRGSDGEMTLVAGRGASSILHAVDPATATSTCGLIGFDTTDRPTWADARGPRCPRCQVRVRLGAADRPAHGASERAVDRITVRALRLAFDPDYAPGPAGHDLARAGENILNLRSARRRLEATIDTRWGDAPALAGQALDYAVSLLDPDDTRPPEGLSRSGNR
jgi:hypothetical protein